MRLGSKGTPGRSNGTAGGVRRPASGIADRQGFRFTSLIEHVSQAAYMHRSAGSDKLECTASGGAPSYPMNSSAASCSTRPLALEPASCLACPSCPGWPPLRPAADGLSSCSFSPSTNDRLGRSDSRRSSGRILALRRAADEALARKLLLLPWCAPCCCHALALSSTALPPARHRDPFWCWEAAEGDCDSVGCLPAAGRTAKREQLTLFLPHCSGLGAAKVLWACSTFLLCCATLAQHAAT